MYLTNQWPLSKAENTVGGAADERARSGGRQKKLCGDGFSHHLLPAVSAALLACLISPTGGPSTTDDGDSLSGQERCHMATFSYTLKNAIESISNLLNARVM